MTETVDPQAMTVSALVGDTVITVPPDLPVDQVAKALVEAQIGAVVLGQPGEAKAIVSERDIVKAVAAGRDLAATPALEIASTDLVWCDATASIPEVAAEMSEKYVRHVLVEDDGALMGIVSARDVLGVYASVDEFDVD